MSLSLKRKIKHALFYLIALVMVATIEESDIITGHNCMKYMHQARIHYVEEPDEEQEDEEDDGLLYDIEL